MKTSHHFTIERIDAIVAIQGGRAWFEHAHIALPVVVFILLVHMRVANVTSFGTRVPAAARPLVLEHAFCDYEEIIWNSDYVARW